MSACCIKNETQIKLHAYDENIRLTKQLTEKTIINLPSEKFKQGLTKELNKDINKFFKDIKTSP